MRYQGITKINKISNDVEVLRILNNQIKSLKGIPSSLPFLKSLTLQCDKLESFKFLPKTLPNLQNIEIKCKSLKSLEHLPQQLPSLTSFIIEESSLRSIEKIPNILHLKFLEISHFTFENLNFLAQKMPHSVSFCFTHSKISNFIGFPEQIGAIFSIYFRMCEIDSFEGFIPDFSKKTLFTIENSTIKSFEGFPELDNDSDLLIFDSKIYNVAGLSRKNLQKVLLALYIAVHLGKKNDILISSKGYQLLGDCIDYHADTDMSSPYYYTTEDKWYNLSVDEFMLDEDSEENEDYIIDRSYIKSLEKELIIPEKVDLLYDYNKRNIYELANQYRDGNKSLSEDEIERLLNEANHEVLKILENSVPSNDPILLKMIEKFSIRTKKGFKII